MEEQSQLGQGVEALIAFHLEQTLELGLFGTNSYFCVKIQCSPPNRFRLSDNLQDLAYLQDLARKYEIVALRYRRFAAYSAPNVTLLRSIL